MGVRINSKELNVYYESIMSLISIFPNYHIGPVLNPAIQLLLIFFIFLFFLAGNVAVTHGICFCRCIFPHKLLTYVPAVTGKCSKYGPCQEFSTQQYSAPVSIYDALCASDLLSVIMQQKDGHNC